MASTPTSIAIHVVLLGAGFGFVEWLLVRLLRWARCGRRGTHALGAVLTEVTQSAVVREAKEGRKRNGQGGGDPSNDEPTP